MKRYGVWGLSAALIVSAAAVANADSQPSTPEQGTLMKKLFGPKQPKPVGPTVRPAITAPLKPEVVADALRAEQDAWLRRVSVCTELRRVGVERGDETLVRQADELERQATAVYHARVAGLGATGGKAPLPESTMNPTVFTFETPTATDPVAKAKKLAAPTTPIPGSTAAVREVPNP